MTNRVQKMDDFIKHIALISQKFNIIDINYNFVYAQLIRFGISKEQGFNIKENFLYWESQFKSTKNVRSHYFSGSFLGFKNFSNPVKNAEQIKIYIPLDEKHIQRGVTELFQFLDNRNISNMSKVAKNVRIDDVVVRVGNINDLLNVIGFVQRNQYIQEGLINPNPFLINYNGIALGSDNYMSFNAEIATLISNYMNDLKKSNNLNKTSYNSFYQYAQEFYKRTFITGENLKNAIKENKSKPEYGEVNENMGDYSIEKIIPMMETYELILKSLDPKSNVKSFINHWESINNQNYKLQRRKYLEDLVARINNQNSNKSLSDQKEVQQIQVLNEACKQTYNKYGYNQLIKAVQEVVKGNGNYFTNDGKVRDSLKSNIMPKEILPLIVKIVGVKSEEEYRNVTDTYANLIVEMVQSEKKQSQQVPNY